MGRTANIAKAMEELSNQFKPQELNEGEVQAIFNRCLAKPDTKNHSEATLFFPRLGYSEENCVTVYFDKDDLLKNKKNLQYLYGQLSTVHTGKAKTELLTITDFVTSYSGNKWTGNRLILMKLLYLGASVDVSLVAPFSKEYGDTTRINPIITPTLSPKDPAFPAWWEAHKAEWEA
ncbi:MAG: hypothetical protein ACI3V3_00585 [Faecousia sp.]